MSPFERPVIIDNDVISRLYSAGILRKVLELWKRGTFYVVVQVLEEGKRWPAEGHKLGLLLAELLKERIITKVCIDDDSEEEINIYAQLILRGKLGKGESASIAIACNRGYNLASDDAMAKDECRKISRLVDTFTTRRILETAVMDGLLSQSEVDLIRSKMR
jgi:hypothetical protein